MKNCKDVRPDICDQYCPTCTEKADYLRSKLGEVTGLSELFKVLGDETRTKILYLLSLQELCVCDLADLLEMSLPAVSHHLRLLKAMRLVKHRREGKQVFYSLDDQHIVELIKQAQEHFQEGR
ncbi:MAG: winged helix-turn-helix transcriptional regulator [Firmicutes bacterium]|nr:winged helix-turn-helix transcriptional regulator [Bacillota bacterium]